MTTKPKKTGAMAQPFEPRKSHALAASDPEDARRRAARYIASPELAAARAMVAAEGKGGMSDLLDVPELVATLREQAKAVSGSDLAGVEAMLMNQATALQSLFARLTERGINADYLPQVEAFMRIALRAQSQCRATLETLAAIKNPPIVYARQANIANGPQQVNNGPHAEENPIEQSKVLEVQHGERLDFGAAAAASGTNPELATVEAIDRTKDRSR